jgi:hypothetical protein
MKNIHVLPTDKIIKNVGDLVKDQYGDTHIFTKNDGKEYGKTTTKLNIYITNSKEIKEGDYCIIVDAESALYGQFEKHKGKHLRNDQWEKIILTTDQELIKDGVQAIDDEFLEWFVKNPSCEEVEIDKIHLCTQTGLPCGMQCLSEKTCNENIIYKIIIPKEEPKEETLEEFAEREATEFYEKGTVEWNKFRQLIEVGAKWQQERSYSEEEVIAFGEFIFKHTLLAHSKGVKNLFEQFKNK